MFPTRRPTFWGADDLVSGTRGVSKGGSGPAKSNGVFERRHLDLESLLLGFRCCSTHPANGTGGFLLRDAGEENA